MCPSNGNQIASNGGEEYAGQTLTTDHQTIQQWAEHHNARPATMPGTEHWDDLGVLRLDFPGYGGQDLQTVS